MTSKFSEFKLIFVTTVHDQQGNVACIYIEKCILINIFIKNNYYFTAVSGMTWLVMPKTSLVLGFSATSIKIWRISTLTPSRLSGSIRKQRVIVCDLQMVYFNPFYVLLYFKVCCFWTSRFGHMFLKSSVLSSSEFFYLLYTETWDVLDPQGEIIPKEFPNPEQPRIWGGGGENKLARSCQQLHLQLLLAYNYWHLHFTQWML